jgi:putative spermidine/putrescine transport system permease protein
MRLDRRLGTLGVVVVVVVVLLPALGLLPVSFSSQRFLELWPDQWTWQWYVNLRRGPWLASILGSVAVAFTSACIAVAVTMPGSYFAAVSPRSARTLVLHTLAVTPAVIPAITLAAGYYKLFGGFDHFSLIFPYAMLVVPVCYFVQLYGFSRLGEEMRLAARMAGASEHRVFFQVFVRGALPQVVVALFLSTVFLLDEGVLSILLTEPSATPFPKLVYETMTRERDLSAAAANVVLFAIVGVLFTVMMRSQVRDLERR